MSTKLAADLQKKVIYSLSLPSPTTESNSNILRSEGDQLKNQSVRVPRELSSLLNLFLVTNFQLSPILIYSQLTL
jgi:hypothetical protein